MINMQVVIKNTGVKQTLSIVDRETNVNYVRDFIGNYGGLTDGQFTYDESIDAYVCDQDTFDWWDKVISDNQQLEDRLSDLRKQHGSERVHNVIMQAGDHDLEDHAAAVNRELDETFPGN